MAEEASGETGAEHATPHRGKVSPLALWLGLAGAPLAWSVQIVVGYALSAHACYPQRTSLAEPLWQSLHGLLLGVSAAAIVLALLSTLLALHSWRITRAEHEGDQHVLVEVGEGRTRFMAMCGLITSVAFLGALIFTALVPFAVRPCGF